MPRLRKPSTSAARRPRVSAGNRSTVGGHRRAEEVAERHVDRRQVLERPDAHHQHPLRHRPRLAGHPGDQIGMQRAGRQLTGAGGGDPDQVGDGRLVGGEEGVEHRRDEDRSAGVRFEGAPQPGRIRVLLAQRVPQRPAPAGALAELLGQLDQRRAGGEVGPVGLDVAGQQLRQREVLEQRHHVGEALVEGVHVDVGRLLVQGAEPIDQGVRRLVHDDVVGQAAEHPLPGQVPAGVARIGAEVAEAQRATVAVVEDRVLTLEAVREDPQSVAPPPAEPAAEPPLEVLQQRAGHRVHHLLVEAGVPLAGREAVLGQQDRDRPDRPACRTAWCWRRSRSPAPGRRSVRAAAARTAR